MTTSEAEAVERVALDYFDGYFDGDAPRLASSLHPELAKRSLRQVDPDSEALRSVTRAQMIDITEDGEGKRLDPGARRIEVEVNDLYGNIASVTVRSALYREYLHFVRTPEGWKIVNALWHWS